MDSFVSSFQGWRTTGRPAAAGRCSLTLMLCLSGSLWFWRWEIFELWARVRRLKTVLLGSGNVWEAESAEVVCGEECSGPEAEGGLSKARAALREGGGRGKDVLQRIHVKGARVTKLNASTNQWEPQLWIWLTQHHPANWWYSWLLGVGQALCRIKKVLGRRRGEDQSEWVRFQWGGDRAFHNEKD